MIARCVPASLGVLLALLARASAVGVTLTVTNTNDAGAGSLRDAVLNANGMPGPDTIVFAIPGTGAQTIPVATPILITDLVTIDGYSQPGATANTSPFGSDAVLQIELQGAGTDGLVVSEGSNIRGLALNGFQAAILLTTGAEAWIHGNFIGTDVLGDPTSSGNAVGISIQASAGVDTIGGTTPEDRNLISGNIVGIEIADSSQTQILSNLIGTDPAGQLPVGNGTGIRTTASSSLQIGTNLARNVISGNFGRGIQMTGGDFNNIDGNYVGTDVYGANALGNGEHGVEVNGAPKTFLIARNVVSGNGGNGLEIQVVGYFGVFNSVTFNFIGTDGGGNQPLGNAGSGIRVALAHVLFIEGNVIAHNANGLWYMGPSTFNNVSWEGNSIYSNHGLGIVLGGVPEVPKNSPGGSFNFPILTSVVSAGGSTTVQGIYHGRPNSLVTLQYYASPGCLPRPQQFDEGKTYLGKGAQFTTDGIGAYAFTDVLPVSLTDERVTAIGGVFTPPGPLVTDGGQLPTYPTSAFSQRLPFSINPRSGAPAGVTPALIHGTDFRTGATVTVGGLPAYYITVQNAQLITAAMPVLPAGTANDIEIVNTDGTRGTLSRGWIADFDDVPPADPLHDFIVTLFANGVTGGIGGGMYGPSMSTTRQQMAVFLLKGKHGLCYVPPPCAGLFTDVPCASPFAAWIEALFAEGITGGCGVGLYCPQNPVRRDQMAVFLLKAKYGPGYVPPPCDGDFADVPCPGPFTDWIEQLAEENITGGCGGGNYCPGSNNTRGQMAVFITKTFSLQ